MLVNAMFINLVGSICDTFHDSRPEPASTLEPFTLGGIEKAIKMDELDKEKDYPNLEKVLLAVFASVESLNSAFSLGLSRYSYSKPNIDFADILTFYTIISSLPTLKPVELVLSRSLALLKRPRHKISSPADICFLLVILENPALYSTSIFAKASSISSLAHQVLERTVSILANTPRRARHYLINWISRFPSALFQQKVELINAYIAHRLIVLYVPKNSKKGGRAFSLFDLHQFPYLHDNGKISEILVPSLEGTNVQPPIQSTNASASPQTEVRTRSKKKAPGSSEKVEKYGQDWRIASFARLQAIFFNANIISRKIPVSVFYNTAVDYIDIKADFSSWELLGIPKSTIQGKQQNVAGLTQAIKFNGFDSLLDEKPLFAFCQYPFMLSMGSKTQILEYEARRQMEYKAHEAFLNSLSNQAPTHAYLHIRVRRTHILQDSFDIFEKHYDELKKAIRVEFVGEPGIDVGGLKKEWFLLLMRELFSSSKGMFKEDEDSKHCWFNTESSQPLRFYELAGVVLGLALYNSTILDGSFAPVLFNRLLGFAYNLHDFKELWPVYGANLQHLLDCEEEDVENIFCLNFTVTAKVNGKNVEQALVADGPNVPVTKANKKEYVNRVVKHYLETSVEQQFEALKKGFLKVVGGNALTLFQPSEIGLLIRGSDDPLDIKALRSVTRYKHWSAHYTDPNKALVVRWFWRYFESIPSLEQRKLLMFITGSDRIPATGISTMSLTITRLGGDCNRFPVSHTCFNELCLYEYKSKRELVDRLSRAIQESEGFGLK